MVWWLANQSSNPVVWDLFPGGENKDFAFQFWYCEPSLKNQCGERRPNVIILECFNCRWEGGEFGKVGKLGVWWSWGGKGGKLVRLGSWWGDHHRKKLFINNSVEALIPFKEEHQGLYWNCMYLWHGSGGFEFGNFEILFIFWGGNRKKRFYSEMWGNAVWGRLVKILWDSLCVKVL